MEKFELEARTMRFSVDLILLVREIKFDAATVSLRSQLIRAGTSIGANYREANRAESKPDFLHKIAVAQKEANETSYWLEILANVFPEHRSCLVNLADESGQILAILISIALNAKGIERNRKTAKPRNR